MKFVRYAIYHTPPDGPLSRFGAQWLGWDISSGQPAEHPNIDGLPRPPDEITQAPRRYGFHATLKPPFHLAAGQSAEALCEELINLTYDQPPAVIHGLLLSEMGSFLALVPIGKSRDLPDLAARVVRDLDRFRAPPSAEEIARRRQHRLTPAQEENLTLWGYPHVMEQFRFHMTLTGRLSKPDLAATRKALDPVLAPLIPQPCIVSDLTLAGEDDQGRFHQIERFAFSANSSL